MYSGIEILGDVANELASEGRSETPDEAGLHIELETDAFEQINVDFRQFVWAAFPEDVAWESTANFLNYLSMNILEVRLLGFRPAGSEKTEWGMDVVFSGCGGMCDTSARLAAHWAQIWYEATRRELADELLMPLGFTPEDAAAQFIKTPDVEYPKQRNWPRQHVCPLFVPISRGAYAAYEPELRLDADDSPFNVDCAMLEGLPDGGEQLFAELDQIYGSVLDDGRCRCQFCDPKPN